MKLQKQLFLTLICLCTIPVMFSTAAFILFYRSSALESIYSGIATSAQIRTESIERLIFTVREHLHLSEATLPLHSLLEASFYGTPFQPNQLDDVRKMYLAQAKSLHLLKAIALIDRKGEIVVSTVPAREGTVSRLPLKVMNSLRSGVALVISANLPGFSPQDPQKGTVNFSSPCFSGGVYMGAQNIGIDVQSLAPLVGGKLIAPSAAVQLFDEEGRLIVQSGAGVVSRSLEELPALWLEWKRFRASCESRIIRFGAGKDNRTGLMTGIGSTGWTLLCSVGYEELIRPILRITGSFIAFLAMLLLVAIYLTMKSAKYITQPLENLMESIARLHGGASDARFTCDLNNEFGVISDAFNGLIEQLNQHIAREQERSRYLLKKSETDSLTGVYNNGSTREYIDAFLSGDRGTGACHALLIVDIDNFKKINDRFGHAAGDTLLQKLAGALRANFRESDVVGRVGGDEFVVLVKHLASTDILEKKLKTMLEATRAISQESGLERAFTISMGVGFCPADGASYQELFEAADRAMYLSKEQGKDSFVFSKKGEV